MHSPPPRRELEPHPLTPRRKEHPTRYEAPVPEDESTGTGDEIPVDLGGVGPGIAQATDDDDIPTEDPFDGDAGPVDDGDEDD